MQEGGTATSTGRIMPPLKWHELGGKYYLAQRIIALMPPHRHYVEPYFGGGAVLFAKDYEGISEVVNDSNRDLTNFWRVLQHETLFQKFQRRVEAIPFSEVEWQQSRAICRTVSITDELSDDGKVLRATSFFVHCRQSLAGRLESFAPLSRNRVRRCMNEQASAWLSAVEGLPLVHHRLKRVVVLNQDGVAAIRQQDGDEVCFYIDPPYMPETRAAPNVYEHEMTVAEHQELLDTIQQCKGKILLSGYANELYDTALKSWTRHTFDLPNHAASGNNKRRMQEVVWCNY